MADFSKPAHSWNLVWDADWVTSVAFLGSPRRVAAGNNLGQIVIWDLPESGGGEPKPLARLDGHSNVVSHLAAMPDGKTLISASYDHSIRYWDIPSKLPAPVEPLTLNARAIEDATRRKSNGAKVPPALETRVGILKPARTLTEHKEWIVGLDLSRDGQSMISGDDGGHVIVWDAAAGTVTRRWRLAKGWAYAVAVSPDHKQACVTERLPLVFDSGRHAAVKLWDATTGEMTRDLSAGKEFKGFHLCAARFAPDNKRLAVLRGGESNGPSGKPVILDPTTGKVIREFTPGHLDGGTDLAWHHSGQFLASSGRDTVVRIWDVTTGKLVSELGKPRGGQFKDWICAIDWSTDGTSIAAADMAGSVHVWSFTG